MLFYSTKFVPLGYQVELASQFPNKSANFGTHFRYSCATFRSYFGCPTRTCPWYLIKNSRRLLFADDTKIRAMNSADFRTLLQSDIRCLQGQCAPNFLKVNISKSRIITFIKYFPYYAYKECDSSITRTTLFKDLGVQPGWKLHFEAHVHYIFLLICEEVGLNSKHNLVFFHHWCCI
jgi:hypothetical protein